LPETIQVDANKLYRVSEVASIFSVTSYTVREWLKAEKIEGFRISGGHWRITGAAITEYANKEWGNANQ
jgi:excisionase family DNA binding protein